jgi:peptidyl-tRNA hydrolase
MPARVSPLYLSPDARPTVEPEDILAVTLVLNGALGMSPGKTATQAFQGCLALYRLAEEDPELSGQLKDWEEQGWRTVVRIAETEGVFARVLDEVDGVVLHDEGLTEVEDGAATAFVSVPHRRGQTPKMLSHKRVPLL